jgi:1-acyl-sn-glycerol-3-phosphate acyltransferase
MDHLAMEPLYGICHYVLRQIYAMFFRGEVRGTEYLPARGAFLIASNHASHLDPPFVGCQVGKQMAFFARKTLWKPGLASWWLDGVGTIPVDRDGGADVTAIKRVLQALKQEKPVILFPEGTRSPDGGLQAPKPGVGLIACRTGVPVVPARIFGSFTAFGKEGRLRLGTPVSVVFGKPLQPSGYDHPADGKERYQRASERIMAAIAQLEEPTVTIV